VSARDSLIRDAVELDILANRLLGDELGAVLGRGGYGRRETISAALGRKMFRGTASARERALCALLDHFEPEHCLKSYAATFDRPRPPRARRSDNADDDLCEILWR